MTLFTDYVLAAGSLLLSVRLLSTARLQRQTCLRLWALGFFLTAVAAAVGGTYHGFALYLGDSLRKVLWDTTLYFIGLGSGFMISGTLAASLNRQDESTRWLMAGVLVSLLGLGVQQSGIQIHENLNHNDLYHCIQLGALYLFYWGARLLRDRRKPLGRAIQSPQND